jgi:predicted RNase H-like nuclease (RuvC/YqgF family)
MDLDPTTVTLALTTLAGVAGNAFQAWKSRAKARENESAKEATDSATTAKAYGDARGDLHDCRGEVEKLKKQNAEQADAITALESSNVVLTNGLANLQRDCAERDRKAEMEREDDRKRLEALRSEFTRWKQEALR